MSSPRLVRRRVWPWLVGVAILAAAIVSAAFFYGAGRTPADTVMPTSAPLAPAPEVVSDNLPTGCLGGRTRDAAMVETAIADAPDTQNGAVEVAAAFVRFLHQYPYPLDTDTDAVDAIGLASTALTKNLTEYFATQPNISGGLVPDATPYYLSTIPGVFYVESASKDDATISIGTGLVANGSLNTTLRGSITVTLSWEQGGWKFVKSEGFRTPEDLYSNGTPFTEGC